MAYSYAKRLDVLKPSPADGILKQMGDPTLISFSGGNPAAETFPVEKIREISEGLLQRDPVGMLQYSLTEGCADFLDAAKNFIGKNFKIDEDKDELIVTSGSLQAIDLLARAVLNDGDKCLVEEASFFVALDAMRVAGGELKGIPLEADGINTEILEKLIKEQKPKMLYVVPNFNNPTGITMSLEKRKVVYSLAEKYGVLIVEDDPYGAIRFAGEEIPSIKSMDTSGIVVYAHSFSKIIAPAMRVSCAVVPKELAGKMKKLKMLSDVHTPVWGQRVCAGILKECDMQAHIGRLRRIYGDRCSKMMEEIDKKFHPAVTFTRPQGGMFLWVTLPEGVDSLEFCEAALQRKVALVPGAVFNAEYGRPSRSFRVCYSTATDEMIEKGIDILGKLTYDFCKK